MALKRIRTPGPQTPEEIAKARAERAQYADKPSVAAMVERGLIDADTIVPAAGEDPSLLEALSGLRLARERLGLSLNDLAERSHIDKGTLSKLETGKITNPTVGTIARYADERSDCAWTWKLEPQDGLILNRLQELSSRPGQ